jgi:hypothetical protein
MCERRECGFAQTFERQLGLEQWLSNFRAGVEGKRWKIRKALEIVGGEIGQLVREGTIGGW